MPLKIYGLPISACTQKVMLTLAEKGQAAELVPVNVMTGEHKQPAYLARHPFGVIPSIEHDGFALYESIAIIRYLDATFPEPALTPRDARHRARMDQMISIEQSYLSRHSNTLLIERVLKPQRGIASDERAVTEALQGIETCAGVLDQALGERRYLACDELTLADFAILPYVAALAASSALPLSSRSHLRRWLGEMTERNSWRSVMSQLPAPPS